MNDDVTKVGKVSNFVTDDGKDLDERYLGINAKAKSAETVDSVSWDTVTGVTRLQPDWGSAVTFSLNPSWTAPSDGLVIACNSSYSGVSSGTAYFYLRVEDVVLYNFTCSDYKLSSLELPCDFPIKKGQVITGRSPGSGGGVFIPYIEEVISNE